MWPPSHVPVKSQQSRTVHSESEIENHMGCVSYLFNCKCLHFGVNLFQCLASRRYKRSNEKDYTTQENYGTFSVKISKIYIKCSYNHSIIYNALIEMTLRQAKDREYLFGLQDDFLTRGCFLFVCSKKHSTLCRFLPLYSSLLCFLCSFCSTKKLRRIDTGLLVKKIT